MFFLQHSLHDKLSRTQLTNTASDICFRPAIFIFLGLDYLHLTVINSSLGHTFLAIRPLTKVTVVHFFIRIFAKRFERNHASITSFLLLFSFLWLFCQAEYFFLVCKRMLICLLDDERLRFLNQLFCPWTSVHYLVTVFSILCEGWIEIRAAQKTGQAS